MEPYLKERIDRKLPEIENINKGVKEALKPKHQKKMKRSESVKGQEEKVKCDKCNFSTVVTKDLRLHIIEKHSTNIFQGHELDSQIQQIEHVDCEKKQEEECELEEVSPKEDRQTNRQTDRPRYKSS